MSDEPANRTTFGKTSCYAPEGIDLAPLGKLGWRAAYLFDLLWKKQFNRKNGRLRFIGRWVALNSTLLQKVIGKDECARTIEMMIERGWLEKDERRHYSNLPHNKYSTHYRLGCALWKSRFHLIDTHSKTLARNRQQREKETQWGMPSSYRYVLKWVRLAVLSDIPEEVIMSVVNKPPKKKALIAMSKDERYRLFVHMIEVVRDHNRIAKKDKYGRLHTEITSLEKTFRQFLTLNGERLVDNDITTSQPVFLGLFCVATLSGKSIYPSNPHINLFSNHPFLSPSSYNPLMYPTKGRTAYDTTTYDTQTSTLPDTIPDDLKLWLKLCCEGRLYEFLMEQCEYPLGDTPAERKENRTVFKYDRFFPVLYGMNIHHSRLLKVFVRVFPTITKIMSNVKHVKELRVIYWDRIEQYGDSHREAKQYIEDNHKEWYSRLATSMQEIEADFMFNQVIPRLQLAGIPCISIHDSLMTTPRHCERLVAIMKEEFARLGVPGAQITTEAPPGIPTKSPDAHRKMGENMRFPGTSLDMPI